MAFNEIMLTTTEPSSLYKLDHKWEVYRNEKYREFKLFCANTKDCRHTVELMKHNTGLFSCLHIHFNIQPKKSISTEVTIMVSSITNGQMYSKMNQLFPNADQILLTSDGAQALIAETAENVVVNTISDNDQLNLSSAIYDQLFKLLIDSSKHYDMVDRAIWNSVFWDSDNYRPDRVSNTVNEIYSKSNEQEKKYLKDVILGKTAVNTSLAVRFARVRANSGVSYDSLNENSTERDSMDNFLVENRNKIEWNDDRFQPKSMNLFAFNIANIRNRNFAEIKTQIKYTTSDLRLPISIDQIIQQKEYVDLENIKYEIEIAEEENI